MSPEANDAPADGMRLQKFLARSGVASRRSSEALISAGRVEVNGCTVTQMGTKVDPVRDRIAVDGSPVVLPDASFALMLNKPAGYVTTMRDPQGRPCVADLVPIDEHPGLYPLGRLDSATTGLLVFATDGALGNALLHPRHHVSKTYRALIGGALNEGEIDQLRGGIMLDDGMTAPAGAETVERTARGESVVELVLHEGRKRQVRRMLDAVGHPVIELERISFGPLELGDLSRGSWRSLSDQELAALYAAARVDNDRL